MFVSILQRLGARASRHPSEPLQSRADSNTRKSQMGGREEKVGVNIGLKTTGVAAGNRGTQVTDSVGPTKVSPARSQHEGHPEAASSRRHEVKTQAKKSKLSVKAAGKPASKAKTAAKVAARPAKPAASKKAAVKKPAKPVSKPKVAAKPVVKAKAKVVAKSAPAKKAPVAAKKPASAKSRPVAKPLKAVKAARPLIKPAVKATPPVTKPAPPKPVAAGKATAKPKEKVLVKMTTKTAASPPGQAAPTIAAAPAPLQTPALKPGRRSSLRNSSFAPPPAPMVPTHSPDAAKASYSAIAERVIAPPPHVAAKKDPKLANNWKTKPAETLTDEEVKAMPDSEYMNDKQLAFFRHKLSLLKQDIHNSAGETTEHLREDTVVVPDPADRATIEEEHALELRTRDRERKLLKKIEQSIARIDSGDYGYCDETGEAIGVGRLIARPTANLSLEAQQRRELKQKMFGD
jgi:DnaK suppressor protein